MTYELAFKKSALKEWKKLGPNVRDFLAKGSKNDFQIRMSLPLLLAGEQTCTKSNYANLDIGWSIPYRIPPSR